MDTVENQVHGLADEIIAEDEDRRAQELVRSTVSDNSAFADFSHRRLTFRMHIIKGST